MRTIYAHQYERRKRANRMSGWRFWTLCLLAAVVLVGAGILFGRAGSEAELREATQANLMEGWALLHEANQALSSHPAAAEVGATKGSRTSRARSRG